jgi:5-methylcytosine-specific restriction endonuclease McrA
MTTADVAAILARDGYVCHLCGLPIPVEADPSYALAGVIDHDVPRALGGSDDPSNLFAAHRVCNSRKGDTRTGLEILIEVTTAGEVNVVGPANRSRSA